MHICSSFSLFDNDYWLKFYFKSNNESEVIVRKILKTLFVLREKKYAQLPIW